MLYGVCLFVCLNIGVLFNFTFMMVTGDEVWTSQLHESLYIYAARSSNIFNRFQQSYCDCFLAGIRF